MKFWVGVFLGLLLFAGFATYTFLTNKEEVVSISKLDNLYSEGIQSNTLLPIGTSIAGYPILWINNTDGNFRAKLEILENTQFCIRNCYAIINVTLFEPSKLPTGFDFLETSNGKTKTLPFNVYTKSKVDVEEPVFTEVCGTPIIANETSYPNCSTIQTGTQIVEKPDWKKYNNDTKPIGSYVIKIESKIDEPFKSIDWSFNFMNVTSNEIRYYWATWNSSFEVGLYSVYNFDEASGTTSTDKIRKFNITAKATSWNITGKNGYGYTPSNEIGRTDYNLSKLIQGTGTYSFNLWIKKMGDCGATKQVFGTMSAGAFAVDGNIAINCHLANNVYLIQDLAGAEATIDMGAIPAAWEMYTLTYNGTAGIWYRNGTAIASAGKSPYYSALFYTNNNFTMFGAAGGGFNITTVTFDEIYVYNRSLTSSEVSDLWNGGAGIFYTPVTESVPEITFMSQYPADLTSTNIANTSVMIQYNITHPQSINTSQTELYWLTNGSTHTNHTWYINGSIANKGFSTIGVVKSNISQSIWNFTLGDNIYPGTYLLNLSIFENSIHTTSANTNLTTDNHLIKAVVFNMSNLTRYNFIEQMIENITPTTASLRIYYCNSTYSTGNIDSSTSCGLVANQIANTSYNHVENQSKHWINSLTINTTSGTLGNIKVTPNGYFVWRGRTGGWSASYIPTIARTDAIQYSSNTGTTYSNLAGTLDYHLHQFDDNDRFNYYVCSNSTTNGIYNCSVTRSDSLNETDLPPSPPIVYSPGNLTYNSTITINYTSSESPVNHTISFYNITLHNADDTYNRTLQTNNSLNLSYVWNNTDIPIGQFNIHVKAVDDLGFTSTGESALFGIFYPFNTTTSVVTSPATPIVYGTESNFTCINSYSLPTEMWINNVNRTDEKDLLLVRGVGSYSINCSSRTTADGSLLGSSQTVNYVIAQATPNQTVALSPSASVSYGTETTAVGNYCNSQLTCTFTENGSVVANPRVATLGVGTYNYTYATNGNTNYTSYSANATLTVTKATPSLAITLSPSSQVTNGTSTTVTGLGCPDSSCILTRNGTVVANPEVTTLPLGIYTYNYSYLGSVNYNAYSTISTLTVNPVIFGGTNGTVNFTAINLSRTISFQVPYRFVTRAMMNITWLNASQNNSVSSCYQETANVSTSCGGLSTGAYNQTVVGFSDWDNLIDGDWSTNATSTTPAYVQTKYSKPSNATGATIQWKTNISIFNVTIPNDCWSYSATDLYIYQQAGGAGTLNCLNSSDDVMYGHAINTSDTSLYEEGVWWNMSTSTAKVNITQGNSQIYYYTGIYLDTQNTGNFYTIVNSYLTSCTYIGDYCVVPITFTSNYTGILNYSDVVIISDGYLAGTTTANTTTYETESQSFTMNNLQYEDDDYTNIEAYFVYKNTSYLATKTCNDMYCNFSKSIDIPLVSATTINSYLWQIALTNQTRIYYYNTSASSITVNNLVLQNCSAGNFTVNFTIYKSNDITSRVNSTFKSSMQYWLGGGGTKENSSFEDTVADTNEFKFCLNPMGNYNYKVSGDVVISGTGYSNNYHYLNNATFNATILEQRLYLLNSSLATATEINVINELQNGLPGYYVQMQQYDVGTGTYFLYGMAKTNYNGDDNVYLNWYDTLYKFIVLDSNGNIVANYEPYKVFSSPQIFKIFGEDPFDYKKFGNVQYTLYYNNVTGNFVATFLDPTGEIAAGCLRVSQYNYTTLYDNCSYTTSGTLSYNIMGRNNGTYISTFYMLGSYDSGVTIRVVLGEIRSEIFRNLDIKDRGFYAFIIIGIAAMIGLFSPGAAIFFGVLGFIAASAFGFIVLTGTTTTLFIGIFILVTYVMWKLRS